MMTRHAITDAPFARADVAIVSVGAMQNGRTHTTR